MNLEPIADFSRYTPLKENFLDTSNVDSCPGGLRDYRPHLAGSVQAVGIGDVSIEQTLDIAYLFRPAPGAPLGRPRNLMPGEIGWGIPWLVDWGTPKVGHKLGEFRQAAEDRKSHEKINAWYPGPKECKFPGRNGFYRGNNDSSRPGTSNVWVNSSASQWRPSQFYYSRQTHSDQHPYNIQAESSDSGSIERH